MKIAIIGAGNMGGAIARGLAGGTKVAPSDIYVSNPSSGKLDSLKAEFPDINVTHDNAEAAAVGQMVILAVKPKYVSRILETLPLGEDCVLVSLAAGVSIADLAAGMEKNFSVPTQSHAGTHQLTSRIFRLMPNIAIRHAQSANIFACDESVPKDLRDRVLDVFSELGRCFIVEESLMDAAMAVGSCSIAYVFKLIEAVSEAGVELGLRYDDAKTMMAQACLGAAQIILRENAVPATEIAKVCSPGGYTIKGVNSLESAGFSGTVIEAVKASVK